MHKSITLSLIQESAAPKQFFPILSWIMYISVIRWMAMISKGASAALWIVLYFRLSNSVVPICKTKKRWATFQSLEYSFNLLQTMLVYVELCPFSFLKSLLSLNLVLVRWLWQYLSPKEAKYWIDSIPITSLADPKCICTAS